ncbi:ATP-dependent DNA ligase [Mycotypha africana]|uniref:ATP-dependent DNA ligase n=1 Tax=Mycotypha africana TaxID=64632 RepID=UPI002300C58F|nr:ATP-dependent DNA ligase [Mycotypha africana]KAI8968397.1 ATP-dependent DNA ligase [Mycotypha africana]
MASQKKTVKKQTTLQFMFGSNSASKPAHLKQNVDQDPDRSNDRSDVTTHSEENSQKSDMTDTITSYSIDPTEKSTKESALAIVDEDKNKRRRIILSDTDEGSDQEDDTTVHENKRKKTQRDDDGKIIPEEKMDLDGAISKEEKDEAFDKEIEIAAVEEKEAKKEKVEMTKIIHTIAAVNPNAEKDISWKQGQPVPYAVLCRTFQKCESTTKRLEITENLVKLFLKVIELSPHSLLELLYLCINKICPDFEGLELGIGESLLMKSIAETTGRNVNQIKSDYKTYGDLGTVAKHSKGSQKTLFKPKPLTVLHVFRTLKEIALIQGNAAQSKKVGKIKSLLVACQDEEAKYIIRHLEGRLRVGFSEQTILSALAQAVVLSKPGNKKMSTAEKEKLLAHAVDTLKYVYNQLPTYDIIIPALLKYPIDELLENCTMHPGVPLKPMLAHPTKSLTEILDRFENQTFTCEFKYDGERAQIHCLEDGIIKVYSRNSENMSVRYPDIMNAIKKWIKPTTTTFILDCEAVAWDKAEGKILPFQVLSTRKRKDVKEEEIKVRVAVFAFDCLYLNGQSLLQESLKIRREKLKEAFQETENEFYFARHMDSNNIDDIQNFLDVSITNNCEGLMVKAFDSPEATYEPSKRSRNWLKVKKDYLSGLGDSMDLVVIGAFHGRGRRTAVFGGYLLACYDPETEEFQTISKVATGFSDENLQNFYDFFKNHIIEQPKKFYCLGENPVKPDVWLEPVQVWEIQCADLTVSPRYMAGVGQVDPSKGISLRFPRFIRIRDDKDPESATTSEQVVEFYYRQASQQGNKKNVADMDYY